ncbi:MAG: regulatory protein RecX [Bdellovibrionota bacterium]
MKEAQNLAYARLARREHSRLELYDYLKNKGVESSLARSLLDGFVEKGWINDERYAELLIRSEVRKGKGAHHIQRKLKAKGISLDLAEIKRLSGEEDIETEVTRAQEIVERRYSEVAQDVAARRRAYQALLRRGFSFEVARQAIERLGKR